jgi:hypothetical protein
MRGREVARVYTHYRKIAAGIVTDGLRRNPAPIVEQDRYLAGAVDYVAVGQNEAVGGEDKTRPGPAAALGGRATGANLYVGDRGADLLDGTGDRFRISIEQTRVG